MVPRVRSKAIRWRTDSGLSNLAKDLTLLDTEHKFDISLYQYRYFQLTSPSSSIRLLRISPAIDDNATIQCELFHTKLSDAPPYIALSYTWGNAAAVRQIFVGNDIIPVTANLWRAIQRLRPRSGESLVLWADAICINQTDEVEKSIQTSKMRTIYQNAKSVAVWLGQEYRSAAKAIQLARELYSCTTEDVEKIMRDPTNMAAMEALALLFRRQYWWRIWVIQEVAVAKKAAVYCGTESIIWDHLDHACDVCRSHEIFLKDIFYERPSLVRTLTHGGPRGLQLSRYSPKLAAPPLLELLLSHKSKKSTEEKDKVFALVGISSAWETFGPIDYSRSTREVYAHTARLIISTSKKLDIICVKQQDHIRQNLPSWVPDWARPDQSYGALQVGLHHHVPHFAAAGDSVADFVFLDGGYTLKAEGFKLDIISAVGLPYKHKGPPKDVEGALNVLHDSWNLFSANMPNADSTHSQAIFARSISCGNWEHDGEESVYQDKLRSIFELSKNVLVKGEHQTTPYASMANSTASLNEEIAEEEEEYIGDKGQMSVAIDASTVMNRRRIFISSRRIVGLAPWNTMEGDIVVILLGCRFPVVVRRIGGSYILVGEAYVDGFMRGEGMVGLEKDKYVRESFEIR